jgi:hypothetical protein
MLLIHKSVPAFGVEVRDVLEKEKVEGKDSTRERGNLHELLYSNKLGNLHEQYTWQPA